MLLLNEQDSRSTRTEEELDSSDPVAIKPIGLKHSNNCGALQCLKAFLKSIV